MKNKKIYIFITISILLLLTLILVIGFIIYNNYLQKDKNEYIKTSKRDSYIIKKFDESYLLKYLQKENNLIVFFASDCHYCVEEAPGLNEFIKQNPNIPVIMVSHDKDESALQKYLTDNNYNWFVILDPEKKIRSHIDPDATGIPSNYLIDENYNILNYFKGPLKPEELKYFYEKIEIKTS